MLGFAPLAAVPLAARESFAAITIDVTASLAGIETVDIASFYGTYFNLPTDALVGVIEDAVPNAVSLPVAGVETVNIAIRER